MAENLSDGEDAAVRANAAEDRNSIDTEGGLPGSGRADDGEAASRPGAQPKKTGVAPDSKLRSDHLREGAERSWRKVPGKLHSHLGSNGGVEIYDLFKFNLPPPKRTLWFIILT